MSKIQIRENGDDGGDPERRGKMEIKCGIIWKNLSIIESCWAEWKSANHEETRSKMYDIRRKGKWNRVNGTGNYTHWLFENSMRFQWSCIKMEIHRCISGLIEQQSRGGG